MPAGSSGGLVPQSFDEFRSVDFWDGFFKERGNRAFEWYGDWRQLRPLLEADCLAAPGGEVLVVGCGNSELSAQLYDAGCECITNIDFSRRVVAAMLQRNLRQRPRMKWQVGDMTAMKFPDASFAVVLDKGGLDALMGEDDAAGAEAGRKLLAEAARVLQPGGCYLCVTLAQAHVLRLLLDTFRAGWALDLSPVPPSPDMARSPLQPVLVRAAKAQPGPAHAQGIRSLLRPAPKAPNSGQLADACQMLEGEIAARAAGGLSLAGAEAAEADMERLHPGRRMGRALGAARPPRFHASVLDLEGGGAQQCCVFLIPQGREAEWLFASEAGQATVARQCGCARVILVSLARGHAFGSTAAVKTELGPLVQPLVPACVRGVANAVPIMTMGNGVGARRVLEEAESALSGRMAVEDVAVAEAGDTRFCRRLVFLANRGLIQSEACLARAPAAAAASSGGKPARRSAAAAAAGEVGWRGLEPDHSRLGMDYHCLIAAALASRAPQQGGRQRSVMVVGLGGGGLAVFLARCLGMAVQAVELDAAVVGLATRHFGFAEGPGLQARVGDGLAAVAEAAPGSLDALVIDAGSGDASLAMSCPPPPFLQPGFLQAAHAALAPAGLLAVNCVTRLDAAFEAAAAAVKAVFGAGVSHSAAEDDVNRVLFAAREGPAVQPWDARSLAGAFSGRLSTEALQDLTDRAADVSLVPVA